MFADGSIDCEVYDSWYWSPEALSVPVHDGGNSQPAHSQQTHYRCWIHTYVGKGNAKCATNFIHSTMKQQVCNYVVVKPSRADQAYCKTARPVRFANCLSGVLQYKNSKWCRAQQPRPVGFVDIRYMARLQSLSFAYFLPTQWSWSITDKRRTNGQADNIVLQLPLWPWRRHNKNLAIANRSRVSCAHNTSTASIGLNITPWSWNLG